MLAWPFGRHPTVRVRLAVHLPVSLVPELGIADGNALVVQPAPLASGAAGHCQRDPPAREVGALAGGTVYLSTADADGNMVSFIQSNYMGFGSGMVVPGTGIGLHNRGHNFSLDAQHPNCIGPSKRLHHTIIPGFMTRGGVLGWRWLGVL